MSRPKPVTDDAPTRDLVDRGTSLLAEYLRDNRTRTDLLKELAGIVVELRSRFTTDAGSPDYGGRTAGYRAVMREIYTGAGTPAEHLDTVQTALRYHVSNLVHELVDADTLSAAGLGTVAARSRLNAQRELAQGMYLAAEGDPAAADPVRVLVLAQALLEAVRGEALVDLEAKRATAARKALERLRDRSEALIVAVPGTSTRGRRKGGQPS